MRKTIAISLLALSLIGCSHIYGEKGIIKNRDTDYLQAKRIPPMKIPPGMHATDIQDHYPVPPRNYPESAKRVDLTPPEL